MRVRYDSKITRDTVFFIFRGYIENCCIVCVNLVSVEVCFTEIIGNVVVVAFLVVGGEEKLVFSEENAVGGESAEKVVVNAGDILSYLFREVKGIGKIR